ncbi:hypothetical protein R1flu_013462 [Riccia fluitans]|uniref:U-box domain-containing protein n=1 Tax=Riccia fluitans TaxID=41844 RepID=A0ABD1YDM4_9MARC
MAGGYSFQNSGTFDNAEIQARVDVILKDLGSGKIELQRNAAEQLRLLAKRSSGNREIIGRAGAIPLLVELLSSQDSQVQVHAVTALLNLSINHSLKDAIVDANAIPPLVEVLKNGCLEAKENAAATLFSLSTPVTNKASIGAAGAFPPLVDLLRDGTYRGKRDAASAIFNLGILTSNKALAVRAGAVTPLMKFMLDQNSKLHDEALATLAVLSSHSEGQVALGRVNIVPILVELIISGESRNKENAIGILLDLGGSDPSHIAAAVSLGVYGPLGELTCTGSEKGRRRALRLIQLIRHLHLDDRGGGSCSKQCTFSLRYLQLSSLGLSRNIMPFRHITI